MNSSREALDGANSDGYIEIWKSKNDKSPAAATVASKSGAYRSCRAPYIYLAVL